MTTNDAQNKHDGNPPDARPELPGLESKDALMKCGDFDLDNWATVYFFLWVTDTKCNPDLGETIARALDPARRTDPEVLEGWITPAYLLAWDLLTWLLEKVTDWCEANLPDGHPIGWRHLVSKRNAQGDPDHNLLFASLMGAAASMINFDQVAEALLTKTGYRQEMHVPLSELVERQSIQDSAPEHSRSPLRQAATGREWKAHNQELRVKHGPRSVPKPRCEPGPANVTPKVRVQVSMSSVRGCDFLRDHGHIPRGIVTVDFTGRHAPITRGRDRRYHNRPIQKGEFL